MLSRFNSFLDIFKKNSDLSHFFDLNLVRDVSKRAYIKKMAIDDVLNFVGRSISQTEFKVYENKEMKKSDWYYKLNVRPNTDTSASDFWQRFIYKLLYDNEVLVILSDKDDLLIADSFERKEYAIYEDSFSNVKVKDYTFKRSFQMGDVIYLKYNNAKLESIIGGMFDDLGDLYGRMIDISMRNNQIRATVNVETTGKFDEASAEKLQNYINKLFDSFSKNSIAIVPQTKGFTYDEVSSSKNLASKQAINEATDLINEFISHTAKLLGVPPALIHGEMADQEANEKNYIKFCIKPLIKKIEDELNAKLFEPEQFLNGSKIVATGIDRPNIFDLATSIDKLVSSGTYNRNEIRNETGYDPIDDGDTFIITKNYQTEEEALKGGE